MTNNREDYLQTIYRIYAKAEKVTNKKISDHLGIAPASVSEMLKKLQAEDLITVSQNEIHLTEAGKKESRRILSCHRLWETFLLEYLEYNWQNVHEQADLLEHVTNDELKDHLNRFLRYPKHCPHGSIIYENCDNPIEQSLLLCKLNVGQRALIVNVDDDEKLLLAYLDNLGLKLHDEVKVMERNAFDDSLVLLCNDRKLSVAAKATKHIYIEILDE